MIALKKAILWFNKPLPSDFMEKNHTHIVIILLRWHENYFYFVWQLQQLLYHNISDYQFLVNTQTRIPPEAQCSNPIV